MKERFYFWLAARLPRRLMYHVLNRVMIDGREVYGDQWILTRWSIGQLRSEYGGVGGLGRTRAYSRSKTTG